MSTPLNSFAKISGIVHQLNILGHVYILFYCYKWSYYLTDCPLFTLETHHGTLYGSWDIMSRQCLDFKIYWQKCLAKCTSSIYQAMYTYYCSSKNGHLPEQIALSSHGKNMMAPDQKLEKWCVYRVLTLKFIGKNVWHSAPAQYMRPCIHIILLVETVIYWTDCPLCARETHDDTIPGSWEMMSRQCLDFKINWHKCLA